VGILVLLSLGYHLQHYEHDARILINLLIATHSRVLVFHLGADQFKHRQTGFWSGMAEKAGVAKTRRSCGVVTLTRWKCGNSSSR
jgi:hypothetical protein